MQMWHALKIYEKNKYNNFCIEIKNVFFCAKARQQQEKCNGNLSGKFNTHLLHFSLNLIGWFPEVGNGKAHFFVVFWRLI
jgi:hypothetical protein